MCDIACFEIASPPFPLSSVRVATLCIGAAQIAICSDLGHLPSFFFIVHSLNFKTSRVSTVNGRRRTLAGSFPQHMRNRSGTTSAHFASFDHTTTSSAHPSTCATTVTDIHTQDTLPTSSSSSPTMDELASMLEQFRVTESTMTSANQMLKMTGTCTSRCPCA